MKAAKKPKQLPSHLLRDNKGCWYLVPEDKVSSVETAFELLKVEPDPAEHSELAFRVEQYEIDSPHRLRLLKWQEMN